MDDMLPGGKPPFNVKVIGWIAVVVLLAIVASIWVLSGRVG